MKNRVTKVALAGAVLLSGLAGAGALPVDKAEAASYTAKSQTIAQNSFLYKGVPVVADSALEKAIASGLLQGKAEIDLSKFSEIKDMAYLKDRVQKVTYQNPLILGVTSYTYGYSSTTKKLKVTYLYSQKDMLAKQNEIMAVASKIIKDNIKSTMTDRQKMTVLYQYLEKNATYDKEAASYVSATLSKVAEQYKHSFNTYGVLAAKKGVCQSYAGAYLLLLRMSGLNGVFVTGTLNGGPHAWVKVKIGTDWRHIDPTNNLTTSGVPFLLFEGNDQLAASMGYKTSVDYWLDGQLKNFNSVVALNDYYVQNKRVAKDVDAFKVLLAQEIAKQSDKETIISIRTDTTLTKDQIIEVAQTAYSRVDPAKRKNLKLRTAKSYIMFVRDLPQQ